MLPLLVRTLLENVSDGTFPWYPLARIMHKFSTAPTKSSGVLHHLRSTTRKLPPASSTYRTVRLRGPTRKRVPSRVAQRTQVDAFVAS